MTRLCLLLAAALSVCSASPTQDVVVPRPHRLAASEGTVALVGVRCDDASLAPQVDAFVDAVHRLGADGFCRAPDTPGALLVVRADATAKAPESYRIEPCAEGLSVLAADGRAFARAAATLLQLVELHDGALHWPRVTIDDAPDQPFRCFLVDMGRNAHSPAVLRRIVDACFLWKVSYLHLHLTDDQLFSWPSRAFPKLLDARSGWTWDDFVALEHYSQARGVTVIPEIDVPGHSTILRERYPEVFGTTPTELATRPEATAGMQALLDELCTVFASTPYVHLGGDEAYGVPAPVQRAFLNRLNRHVRARGRRSLVWEGPPPGEGDDLVDRDVVHVNWQTTAFPAQQMLDLGYEVVNASWDPLYVVDHYPRTMFTAVSLDRLYAFDRRRFAQVDEGFPTFLRPHVTDRADGILGFCLAWWEGREENVLPLCVPRLAAVAAAAWNRAGERDFTDFMARQRRLLLRYEQLADASLGTMPFADGESQRDNLAFRGAVTVSAGATQPVFGPARLTNGIPDRFDHFLGYPTKPEPLEITVELRHPAELARIVVHERAIGDSHEVYDLLVSADGAVWQTVGEARHGSRGERRFVEHRFAPRLVRFVRVQTQGCHGLTFPSFSRLSEIEAFER